MKIQSVRGFNDILPDEITAWQMVEATAREVFELYGYSEIRTPVLEKVELFSRSVGEDTDIVQKEMYIIENQREGNMAMRPEGTASIVRAYLEHAFYATRPTPEKLYYILPMFRHERPQAGRFRQFHQIGAEALGVDHPAIDAEICAMVIELLKKLNVSGIEVQLNSVGCKQCRPVYRERLKAYLKDSYDKLCQDCQNRFERNPMRILDCKNEACQAVVASAPVILDHYCQDCHAHFTELQEYLGILGIDFDINPRMVRGLDYYVRTAFEFISPALGAQSAILGGGRYDGLSEDIGGPPLPGVGFAMGIERLISLLQLHVEERPSEVFIAVLGSSARKPAVSLQKDLRRAGIRTEIEYQEKSLKSQMKKAGKLGVSYVVMIGADELQKGIVILRNMAESSQHEVAIMDIISTLVNLLA
jgi:histidyl-tRNA synthetase